MAGGGGSRYFRPSTDPRQEADKVRDRSDSQKEGEFVVEVAAELNDLLGRFNNRDKELTQARLDEILEKISDLTENAISTLFGGSVARHTYVDGLSDIDCLLTLSATDAAEKGPKEFVADIAGRLKEVLPNCEIGVGRLAVTVTYPDSMSIQLLPAVKTEDSIRIANSSGEKWSKINPQKFREALTKVNDTCGKKLVPTIKLVKSINDSFPEDLKLTGYHIESMAINIFRNYSGDKNTKAMTEHFFDKAQSTILSKVRDRSGQSVHVDDYLGGNDSEKRVQAGALLNRIHRRIKNANSRYSKEAWVKLITED